LLINSVLKNKNNRKENYKPEHVCPVWMGYLLASPIRELFQNPHTILKPYIREGMKALDIGSAMGFFTIPMAKMVGATGKEVCADLQQKMLGVLEKKSRKAGLSERMELRLCSPGSLNISNIKEELDFELAFAVLHEVPDVSILFKEVYQALKKNGIMLIAEPKGHVNDEHFLATINTAKRVDLFYLACLRLLKVW
jgi:ubiquinone/menaquinone biosynthesis C-methylase UbiE